MVGWRRYTEIKLSKGTWPDPQCSQQGTATFNVPEQRAIQLLCSVAPQKAFRFLCDIPAEAYAYMCRLKIYSITAMFTMAIKLDISGLTSFHLLVPQ